MQSISTETKAGMWYVESPRHSQGLFVDAPTYTLYTSFVLSVYCVRHTDLLWYLRINIPRILYGVQGRSRRIKLIQSVLADQNHAPLRWGLHVTVLRCNWGRNTVRRGYPAITVNFTISNINLLLYSIYVRSGKLVDKISTPLSHLFMFSRLPTLYF